MSCIVCSFFSLSLIMPRDVALSVQLSLDRRQTEGSFVVVGRGGGGGGGSQEQRKEGVK